jgi:hypothetical protein
VVSWSCAPDGAARTGFVKSPLWSTNHTFQCSKVPRPIQPDATRWYSSPVQQETDEDEIVACLVAPMGDAKEILAACADADIEATLARGACCGKNGCGCAPKMQLMVAKGDVPRVARLLQSRWDSLLEREGVEVDEVEAAAPTGAGTATDDENLPCPACGTAAPLVEGACSDCGLQLE